MTEPLEGGVYIDKRILNHSVFLKSDYGWAWVYLLLLANDKPRTVTLAGQRVEIKRGQLAWSLIGLQKKLGKGRKWFTSFLNFCKDEGMLTVKTHRHGAIITILNYDAYNQVSKPDVQTSHRTEVNGSQQQRENTKEQAPIISNIPCSEDVQEFCSQFVDSARGITKIPGRWCSHWLMRMFIENKDPVDWRRALQSEFISDWDSGRVKTWARQQMEEIQALIIREQTPDQDTIEYLQSQLEELKNH